MWCPNATPAPAVRRITIFVGAFQFIRHSTVQKGSRAGSLALVSSVETGVYFVPVPREPRSGFGAASDMINQNLCNNNQFLHPRSLGLILGSLRSVN